jgi:hypothetical protein
MNFIAEEQTCFVVYPAQRSDANQSKCWNWFAQLTSNAAEVSPRSWVISGNGPPVPAIIFHGTCYSGWIPSS